jgi:signal transduction histidine kinase
LQRLTEDILDVARIESQTLTLKKSQFNLKELILNVIADYKSQKGSKVKLVFASLSSNKNNDDILVYGDVGRINEVISNLVSNAVKFTEGRGNTVYITTEKIKKNNDHQKEVIIKVKDTGAGIDAEIMPRLFSKFATKSETGTGLGLFISKSIIEAHGGRIWAKNNTDGKGATFSFSLPTN